MFGGETFSALDRCNNLFFRRPTLMQSIPGMWMQSDFHKPWIVGRGSLFAANLERADGGFCHETVLVKVDGTLSPS